MLSTDKVGLTWPPPQGLSLVLDLHRLGEEGEASSGCSLLHTSVSSKDSDSSSGQQDQNAESAYRRSHWATATASLRLLVQD